MDEWNAFRDGRMEVGQVYGGAQHQDTDVRPLARHWDFSHDGFYEFAVAHRSMVIANTRTISKVTNSPG
jgi:hypothetical protein